MRLLASKARILRHDRRDRSQPTARRSSRRPARRRTHSHRPYGAAQWGACDRPRAGGHVLGRRTRPDTRPVHVDRVEREDGGYRLHAGDRSWTAPHVVAATGTWSTPFVPAYPGLFTGTQWHSANYPGVGPFRGSSVAVVGAANSAAQIAAELTGVAEVTWYTRHPPRWMPDEVDGRVLFRRNRQRALAVQRGETDPGADSELGDIVVLPEVRAARDAGWLAATPMFNSLNEVRADHLIWCTGFRPSLGPVRRLLDGTTPKYPGLHLIGYGDWTGPGSATLTGVGPYAKQTARTIADSFGMTVK